MRIIVIPRDPCRLRMSEWRSEPELVKRARAFLDDPNFRVLLDVLRTEALHNATLVGVSLEERAVWQARCEGYSMALNNLEAMGTLQKPTPVVEPEYAEPEKRGY